MSISLLLESYFEHPFYLIGIPLIFLILLFLFSFKKTRAEDRAHLHKLRRMRILLFITRFLILSLLFIALASPYGYDELFKSGDPRVTILTDNSSSFNLYDRSMSTTIAEALKKVVKVKAHTIGQPYKSPLADDASVYLDKGGSVLLISDGQNNAGASLGDLALTASNLNITINALHLEPVESDYAIEILGPSKITVGVEALFTITVTGTKPTAHGIKVYLDDELIADETTDQDITFYRTFTDGYHTIKAVLNEDDYFLQNNEYYKTIKVVDKPPIAFVSSKESPLLSILEQAYAVAQPSTISNLEEAYALVINDLTIDQLQGSVSTLSDFVSEGNGLVVFGGSQSFDRGNYENSVFESILPVHVGSAEKEEGSSSIVIVIDVSGSTSQAYSSGGLAADVEKALAISILEDIKKDFAVGVVAFDTEHYTVSPLDMLHKKDISLLKNQIASLTPHGGTLIGVGLAQAIELLKSGPGSKNIILISDGNTQQRDQAYAAAAYAAEQHIKIYTIGVGEQTNEIIMKDIATIGEGTYFQASQKNKLKLLFGDPEGETTTDTYGVVIFDENHFITEHLNILASLYGINEAVPRPSGKLLVITDKGDPLIVAGRYGLGRVVVILTDDGSVYAGELLNNINARLLIRALNWAVGDPERKKETFVTIPDTFAGEQATILTKSSGPPSLEGVTFSRVDNDLYSATIPATTTGFVTLLGVTFAVNHEQEYNPIGISPELSNLVSSTGGTFFDPDDIRSMTTEIKRQSKQSLFDKDSYGWIFVLEALFLFLIELYVRKIMQYKHI